MIADIFFYVFYLCIIRFENRYIVFKEVYVKRMFSENFEYFKCFPSEIFPIENTRF